MPCSCGTTQQDLTSDLAFVMLHLGLFHPADVPVASRTGASLIYTTVRLAAQALCSQVAQASPTALKPCCAYC